MTDTDKLAIAKFISEHEDLIRDISEKTILEYAISQTYSSEQMTAYREGVMAIHNFMQNIYFEVENIKTKEDSAPLTGA